MNYKKQTAIAVLGVLGLLTLSTTNVSAADYSNENPEFSIALSPIDGQQKTGGTTWDIKTEPNKKFGGVVYIQNTSKADATYDVSVQQGFTNSNLVVGYASGNNNKSLPANMRLNSIVKVPQEKVTVKAGQTVYAPINFKTSAKSFDGTIIGAVVVTKQVPKGDVKQAGLTNQFSYVKGIKLSETDKPVTADLVNTRKGRVVTKDSQQVFELGLANNQANYIGDLKVKTTIKHGNKVVMQDTQASRQIAPNASFKYQLPANQNLAAGKYSYRVEMVNTQSKKNWVFTGDFQISAVTQGTVALRRSTAFIPAWIWWLMGILIAGFMMMLFMLLKSRRQKDK